MNRIKYPSKKEMHQQISIIIDRSGIFHKQEQEGDTLQFTECKPVRHRGRYTKAMADVCVMAAAAVLLVFAANQFLYYNMRSRAMTDMGTEKQEAAEEIVNEQIVVQMQWLTIDENGISKTVRIPTVYLNGKEVEGISNFYETHLSLQNDEPMDAAVQAEEGEKADAQANAADSAVRHDCSVVKGISDHNMDVISFFENYYEQTKEDGMVTTMQSFSARNFNVVTGEQISIQDIFTDSEKGISELASAIYREIYRNLSDEDIGKYRITERDIRELLFTDQLWCFDSTGIRFCCNESMQTSDVSEDGTTYIFCAGTTVTIPYSELVYLKDEYRN